MDKALFISMAGAKQVMQAQAVNSNNLANASTIGFRSDFVAFMDQSIPSHSIDSRANSVLGIEGSRLTVGPVQTTDRPLDIALQDKSWLAVQSPDGTEAYTRRGDLKVDAYGLLTTADGHPVIGNGGPIAIPPHQSLYIGQDGTLSLVLEGQTSSTSAVIDQLKLVSAKGVDLNKSDNGLFYTDSGEDLEASSEASLLSGALEGSNVNSASAMVNMIALARQFEAQVKLMEKVDKNAELSQRLMRME